MGFEYVRPQSLTAVLEFLVEKGQKARILAGGTDIMVGMRSGKIAPEYLLDIKGFSELEGIRPSAELADGLFIGALTRVADVHQSPLLCGPYAVLAQAAGTLASIQIRNLATIGGNICNAAPSADTAMALLVLDAQVEILSTTGKQLLPLVDFFTGPGQTILGGDKLLLGFHLPVQPENTHGMYIKHSPRAAMDCCVIGVAGLVSAPGGSLTKACLAIGAVAPTPLRVTAAEEHLLSAGSLTTASIAAAARLAGELASPIDDVRGQAWYRKRMVVVDTRRILTHLAGEIEE